MLIGCRAGIAGVEADSVEDGLHAFADVFEFAFGDVLDAADIAAAKVVDDGVESVAGVVALGGVDLVTGFGADAAVLVVAMGEGNAGDLRCGNSVRGSGDRLRRALVCGDVGGNAEVEERSAEGGVGVRVEAYGGDSTHLGGVGGVAGVEAEGADVAVFSGNVPGRRDGKGDPVTGIVEGTSRGSVRLGGWRLALKQRRHWFGSAGNRPSWSLGVGVRDGGKKCQQDDCDAGKTSGESHASFFG